MIDDLIQKHKRSIQRHYEAIERIEKVKCNIDWTKSLSDPFQLAITCRNFVTCNDDPWKRRVRYIEFIEQGAPNPDNLKYVFGEDSPVYLKCKEIYDRTLVPWRVKIKGPQFIPTPNYLNASDKACEIVENNLREFLVKLSDRSLSETEYRKVIDTPTIDLIDEWIMDDAMLNDCK
ncbi:hypothetical protein A3K73_04740 [Candidatus Pacearchaeota archaeon RBG_13_36_9]|nr:MAG: hypothetical protein A3K73_04740 [Candidatus Pacearchaeota archaeon RBG_13_36_9]